MPLSLQTPLSIYSIPVIWFTSFYPMNMKFRLIQKTIGYNNLQPRANTAELAKDGKVPPEIAAKAQRLEGAHLNGNEILPLWIGAILAGNIAGLTNATLNIFSASFIGVRLLYNYIYITQSTVAASNLRTAVWVGGVGICLSLYILAGNAIRSA